MAKLRNEKWSAEVGAGGLPISIFSVWLEGGNPASVRSTHRTESPLSSPLFFSLSHFNELRTTANDASLHLIVPSSSLFSASPDIVNSASAEKSEETLSPKNEPLHT